MRAAAWLSGGNDHPEAAALMQQTHTHMFFDRLSCCSMLGVPPVESMQSAARCMCMAPDGSSRQAPGLDPADELMPNPPCHLYLTEEQAGSKIVSRVHGQVLLLLLMLTCQCPPPFKRHHLRAVGTRAQPALARSWQRQQRRSNTTTEVLCVDLPPRWSTAPPSPPADGTRPAA